MDINSILILLGITIVAYTLKGLTGFGPALIVVPFFTVAVGVKYALPASAIFDAISGLVLLPTVYKQISWKFCIPLMVAMAIGSFIGANLIFAISPHLIRNFIGGFIFLFGGYLWIEQWKSLDRRHNKVTTASPGSVAAGLAGGVSGGMIGMSGPILVIYLKYFFQKDFFRSQLIAIFLAENVVRIAVYLRGGLLDLKSVTLLMYCLPAMLAGLWIGNKLHFQISERAFNRIVSIILILVSTKLLFF
jgi:uncharacterized membrane protein YfcA